MTDDSDKDDLRGMGSTVVEFKADFNHFIKLYNYLTGFVNIHPDKVPLVEIRKIERTTKILFIEHDGHRPLYHIELEIRRGTLEQLAVVIRNIVTAPNLGWSGDGGLMEKTLRIKPIQKTPHPRLEVVTG